MHELNDIVNAIHTADCAAFLKAMPEDCVDVLVTDPPYGIAFMGKDWDKALPSVEVWRECLRVLKPGAFAFVMSIPRSDCYARMIGRLIKAGFDVAFTPIFWAYASGFPKAMNVTKAAMKKLGDPGEVVGKEKIDIGIQSGSMHAGRASKIVERAVVVPTTKACKELEGSYGGFQPKPAVEVIIVAQKPMSQKTFIDQALKNQKGITWLDDCRIPFGEQDDAYTKGVERAQAPRSDIRGASFHAGNEKQPIVCASGMSPAGRFPANLLVSDDVLNDGRVTKSQGGKSGHTAAYSGGFKEEYYQGAKPGYGDIGSFSRYFDVDRWWEDRVAQLPQPVQQTFPFLVVSKASKSERNKGMEETGTGHVTKLTQHGGAWLCACGRKYAAGLEVCPRCGSGERQLYEVGSRPIANTHPTVKPIKLMAYLVMLGSRQGDIVLDPFVGSGTTAIAAKMFNRYYLGIEIEAKYAEIARKRVEAVGVPLEEAG